MGKVKTLKKQKKSLSKFSLDGKNQFIKLKPGAKTFAWNPTTELLDESNLGKSLFKCLTDGDTETFKEILTAHLAAKVKTKTAKAHGLSERTMYEALSEKGNPSLNTIVKLMQMAFAA
jgi:probable addiction module antidote protein